MKYINLLRRRGLALFLAVMMCVSLLPTSALAAPDAEETEPDADEPEEPGDEDEKPADGAEEPDDEYTIVEEEVEGYTSKVSGCDVTNTINIYYTRCRPLRPSLLLRLPPLLRMCLR